MCLKNFVEILGLSSYYTEQVSTSMPNSETRLSTITSRYPEIPRRRVSFSGFLGGTRSPLALWHSSRTMHCKARSTRGSMYVCFPAIFVVMQLHTHTNLALYRSLPYSLLLLHSFFLFLFSRVTFPVPQKFQSNIGIIPDRTQIYSYSIPLPECQTLI